MLLKKMIVEHTKREGILLTRVRIRPTGVESKKSMGALKMESVKPEKNAFEALNPKIAESRDLR